MKKQSTANFLYRIGHINYQAVLLIWDKDRGNRSVTNDIENVVADIAFNHAIEAKEHLIIYRDSTGRWDGWDAEKAAFFPVGSKFLDWIAKSLNFTFENPSI